MEQRAAGHTDWRPVGTDRWHLVMKKKRKEQKKIHQKLHSISGLTPEQEYREFYQMFKLRVKYTISWENKWLN